MRGIWIAVVVLVAACKQPAPERHNYCFVAGTEVATPRGPVPIERLRVGDLVWSWDLRAGRPIAAPVTAVLRGRASEVLELSTGGARIAGVTGAHPFFEARRGRWIQAADLRPGDQLLEWREAHGPARTTALEQVEVRSLATSREVYNLEVAVHHAYFAEGLLVHNKQPLPPQDADADGVSPPWDCADHDPAIHDGAVEVCGDAIDQSCDGRLDDGCVVARLGALGFSINRGSDEGRVTLAPPYALELELYDPFKVHWVAAVDLGGGPRVVPIGGEPPPPWHSLPDDAALPAVVAHVESYLSDVVLVIAIAEGRAWVTFHSAIELDHSGEGLCDGSELVFAPAADGTPTVTHRVVQAGDCVLSTQVAPSLPGTFRWDGEAFTEAVE